MEISKILVIATALVSLFVLIIEEKDLVLLEKNMIY